MMTWTNEQGLGFAEGWKTGRLEEVLVLAIFLTSNLPIFQTGLGSKHKFNIENCLTVK